MEQNEQVLGRPIDARAYRLTQWLRGETLTLTEQGPSALLFFQPELVWKWVEQDVDKHAWYLATFVPKFLFRREGTMCWARELLVRYGDREDVRGNLYANFSTEGWSGKASIYFQKKKEGLLAFRMGEDNENVLRWIDDFVTDLDRQIEFERVSEEREDF